MKISKQARRKAKRLFRGCLLDGLLNENQVRQAVRGVSEQKPRGFLQILTHFERLVKLEEARRTATIQSAVPLSDDLRNRMQSGLSRLYGGGLRFSFAENPALLGGVRIQVGSDVYDGSVQARLAALEQNF